MSKSKPPPKSTPPPPLTEEERLKAAQAKRDAEYRAKVDPKYIIRARLFNRLKKPPEVPAIYKLNGIEVATPGNLVVIASAVKTGKSAVIGAMCAATMANEGNADLLLGFQSGNDKARAVLHFDSEQSRYHSPGEWTLRLIW